MQIYVVKENDTLDSISAAFMVSAEDIAYPIRWLLVRHC